MFGERLRMVREEVGLTQKLLADKLYVSQQSVWKWEMNKSSPNPETVAKIAEICEVSTDYLLGRTNKKEMPAPKNGGGLDDDQLDKEFMRWFQGQSPERQKEVLFDLAKAVTGQGK